LGPFERAVGTRFTGGRSLAVQLIVGVPFSLASDKQNVKYMIKSGGFFSYSHMTTEL
jgi:hypothetical protein